MDRTVVLRLLPGWVDLARYCCLLLTTFAPFTNSQCHDKLRLLLFYRTGNWNVIWKCNWNGMETDLKCYLQKVLMEMETDCVLLVVDSECIIGNVIWNETETLQHL